MNNYMAIIELGEDATAFAEIIGVRGIYGHRYICEYIDAQGVRIHQQTFSLPKGIEGLPANNASLMANVLNSWKSEQAKSRRAQGLETEEA